MSRKDFVPVAARDLASLAAGMLCGVMLVQTASASGLTPPNDEISAGILDLSLGASNTVRFLPPSGATANVQQDLYFLRRNDCRLRAPSSSDNQTELLKFSATSGGVAAPVGLVSGSMGVFSGSQGTPCSRFASGASQALDVSLGKDSPAPSFYLLELDIEAKANLAVELWVYPKGATSPSARYLLRTGSSVSSGYLPAADSSLPQIKGITDCNAPKASDSGPDAGALDNCSWTVREYGSRFRLVPRVGEGSLESGTDSGFETRVHLTNTISGTLGCNTPTTGVEVTPTLGDGEGLAQCTVTRVDTGSNGIGGSCTRPVAYVLRSIGGSGCELLKAPGEQLAASLRITFPPEARKELKDENELLTKISFSNPDGSLTVPFEPRRCLGTVVMDKNWTRTIQEVLDGSDPEWVLDQVASPDGIVDWACVLDHEEVYVGGTEPEMQTSQTILFWGDIRFSRE